MLFLLGHNILKQNITTASRSVTHISDEIHKHKKCFILRNSHNEDIFVQYKTMTGLQMQLLMSIHVHSQKKFRNALPFDFFLNRLVQAQKQNRISSKRQHCKKNVIFFFVSVCFSLTSCEICAEIETETWISSLIF